MRNGGPSNRPSSRAACPHDFQPRLNAALLAAVSRGEYTINGLRNRDVRRQLWAKVGTDKEQRRRAAAVTRPLRLLRKVSGTHRYVVTGGGRKIITACWPPAKRMLNNSRHLPPEQIFSERNDVMR